MEDIVIPHSLFRKLELFLQGDVLRLFKEINHMNRRLIHFLLVALLLAACTGTNNLSAVPTVPPMATPEVPSFLLPVGRVTVHSASYTITVRNPAQALSELQRAVEKAGGYVDSASSWSGEGSGSYASLSAQVPPDALPALSEALNKIAGQIQSQNSYVQDVTSEIVQLQQRHQDLTQAQDQMLLFLINTRDLDRLSTYRMIQELLDNELKAVESQLGSYEKQSRLASLDITINQPQSLSAPIE
jgi:hypothetical protein